MGVERSAGSAHEYTTALAQVETGLTADAQQVADAVTAMVAARIIVAVAIVVAMIQADADLGGLFTMHIRSQCHAISEYGQHQPDDDEATKHGVTRVENLARIYSNRFTVAIFPGREAQLRTGYFCKLSGLVTLPPPKFTCPKKANNKHMFQDILTKTYYGNTIGTYMLSFLLIIASVVLARVVYWAIGHVIKRLTRKTKNRLDDILVDMLEEPVVFAIVIIGIWFSLKLLHTSAAAQTVISTAYYILIVFDVAWFLSRVLDALVKRYIVPLVQHTESKLDDQLLPIIQKGLKIALWVMALLIALNNAGYNVGAVLASLGIGGIAFAMAAKDTIANLFGSFTIFMDKPFTVGERVLLNGYDGFVREIGVRSTRLETLNGRMVTLPNSQVANECIENISSEPSRKITLDLGLTYDTSHEDMQKAMDILQQIVKENGRTEEKVVTAFTAFNDFALNIRLIYYITKGESVFGVQTEINLEILRRFNEAGLEFAFPTQTIYTIPVTGS